MKKKRRYFQWIDGEMKGDVVTLENIEEFEGETFYNFDDGESCNLRFISKMTNSQADLKNKFMVEVESPSNVWSFEEIKPHKYVDESMKGEDIDIPSLHDILQAHGESTNIERSDIGTEKLVPPRREQRLIELPSIDDFPSENKVTESKPVNDVKPVDETKPVVKSEDSTGDEPTTDTHVQDESKQDAVEQKKNISFDPVRILVDSCKKHDTPIDLSLSMKLPSKYIANIASSEFEDGADKFIDCIVEDIDIKLIISELKSALKDAYYNSITVEE